MLNTIKKGGAKVDRKRITISSKRQITIPQKFFDMLGFDNEAEFILRGNELVLRPIKEPLNDEFSTQILEDLINRGFSGEELLVQFKAAQKRIRPAIEALLSEAELAADGKGTYFTYNDIFEAEQP